VTKIAELKKKLMSNPEFQREYEKADAEFQIIEALILARMKANLSQAEVASGLEQPSRQLPDWKAAAYLLRSQRCGAMLKRQAQSWKSTSFGPRSPFPLVGDSI
jgi:hypothetical protein